MDQVELGLSLNTSRADAAIEASAKRARELFERRGIKLNVKSPDLPLGRITGDMNKFSDSLDAAASRVLAFTATTSVVYGLARAFAGLFTESIKLEKQLATIQSVLQTSNTNLNSLKNELFSIANATGQAFDVAASAAEEFARQGLSVQETAKATAAALAFSKIAGIDAATSVQTLTAALNTFNDGALDYTDIVDTITTLDTNFAISAAGIADGLKRIGSVASEAGIDLKEIASLISVVQQVSARGAPVISNGLKTIFTRLNRSSVQEALQGIGVQTQDSNGGFRSQIDILKDLSNVFDTLSDSQRAYISEQVAGVYQINTLQATLKTLRGEYSLYEKAVNIASDSSGSAAERLKILTQTTDASLQTLKNNVSQFLAETGKVTVKPILDNFVGLGNSILETLNKSLFSSDAEGVGATIGKRLLTGLSSVLSGPGTIAAIFIVTKLLAAVVKDGLKALATLAKVKSSSISDSDIQKTVNSAIANGNALLVERLRTTTNIVTQTQILNKLLADQANRQSAAQISSLINTGLGRSPKKGKAAGFIPNFNASSSTTTSFSASPAESFFETQGALEHGYKPGKVYSTRIHDGNGKSEMSVVNSAENVINFVNDSGKKATMVIPPNGFGKGTQYAARGFIPNFATKNKKQILKFNQKINGPQSSLVADKNKDEVRKLKYEVEFLDLPDYSLAIKNNINEKKFDAEKISSIAKKRGYSEDQINLFFDNIKSGQTDVPSLKDPKKLVPLERQIRGFSSNVGGFLFEKAALKKINKNNKTNFNLATDPSARMDIVFGGKDVGEIKSGRINYDNLIAKAIVSKANKDKLPPPYYKDGKGKPIEFTEPFKLFRRDKKSEAKASFFSKAIESFSNGFIPSFAPVIRRVGILDGDVLNNPRYADIVGAEMARLGFSKVYEYYEYLGNIAAEKKQFGGLKKVRAIYGPPGSGKTSLAFNLDKFGNPRQSERAIARETIRIPILQASDINKVDEVLATKASIATTEPSLRSGFLGKVDKFYSLNTPDKDVKTLRRNRIEQAQSGATIASQGRSLAQMKLQGVSTGSEYIQTVSQDTLGRKAVRIDQKIDEEGNLKRIVNKDKYNIVTKKIALAYGAFAPFTKGHEQIFTQALSMGFNKEDVVFAVSSGAQMKQGDSHSYRTAIFPSATRAKIIKKATGAQTTFINSSDFRNSIPSIIKLSDGSYVKPAPGSIALTGDDKGNKELEKYTKAGYTTVSGERSEGVSGTELRKAIEEKDIKKIRELSPAGSADFLINNLDVISNRSAFLSKLEEKQGIKTQAKLAPIQQELSMLPQRITANTPPDVAEKIRALRANRDKIKESSSTSRIFKRAEKLIPGLQFEDYINIGEFLPNNPNAREQFGLAVRNNKNVENDDKISEIAFKQIEVKIPDKGGKRRDLTSSILQKPVASYRFKSKERVGAVKEPNDYTGVFEKYAIQQANKTKAGSKFIPTRRIAFGKGNAAVDAFSIDSIKDKKVSLLEAKAGYWEADEAGNKFGRFIPENLIGLSPMLSPLFTEGVPDKYDKIKLTNYVAVPDLNSIPAGEKKGNRAGPLRERTGGTTGQFFTPEVIDPRNRMGIISKSTKRSSTGNIAISAEQMSGLSDEQRALRMLRAGQLKVPRRGISSGFIPNFAPQFRVGNQQKITLSKSKLQDHIDKGDYTKAESLVYDALTGKDTSLSVEERAKSNLDLYNSLKGRDVYAKTANEKSDSGNPAWSQFNVRKTGKKPENPSISNFKKYYSLSSDDTQKVAEKSTEIKSILKRISDKYDADISFKIPSTLMGAATHNDSLVIHTSSKDAIFDIEKELGAFFSSNNIATGSRAYSRGYDVYTGEVDEKGKAKSLSYGQVLSRNIISNLINSYKQTGDFSKSLTSSIPNIKDAYSSGFIPNFSGILNDAKNREMAAGYSRNEVKVGKDKSLVNPLNPEGFGVFNREEGSLKNGINLAKKAGINPITKGMAKGFVPNFNKVNDLDIRDRGMMASGFVPNFAKKQSKPNFKKGAKDALKIEEQSNIEFITEGKSGLDLTQMGIESGKKIVSLKEQLAEAEESGNKKKIAVLEQQIAAEEKITSQFGEDLPAALEPFKAGQEAFIEAANKANEFIQGLAEAATSATQAVPNIPSAGGAPPVSPQGPGGAPPVPPQGPGGAPPVPPQGPGGKKGGGKFPTLGKIGGKLGGLAKNLRGGGIGGLLSGAAIQFVTQSILPEEEKRSKGQKLFGDAADALGAGLSAASLLAPAGPIVAGIAGAVAGGYSFLNKRSQRDQMQEQERLQKESESLKTESEKETTNVNAALQARGELQQLETSGGNAKAIASARMKLATSVSGIEDKNVARLFTSGASDDEIQKTVSSYLNESQRKLASKEGSLGIRQLATKKQDEQPGALSAMLTTNPFAPGGLFGGGMQQPKQQKLSGEEIKASADTLMNAVKVPQQPSKALKNALDQMSKGMLSTTDLIKRFGGELGLNEDQINDLSGSFEALSVAADTEELNKYISGLVSVNSELQKKVQVPKALPGVQDAGKIINQASEDLIFDTQIKQKRANARQNSAMRIEENILNERISSGELSQPEAIRAKTNMQLKNLKVQQEQEAKSIVTSSIGDINARLQESGVKLDAEKQSQLLQVQQKVAGGQGDVSEIQKFLSENVKGGGDREKLGQIFKDVNGKILQSLTDIEIATETQTAELLASDKLALEQLKRNETRGVGQNALSGEAGKAQQFLKSIDYSALSKKETKVSELEAKAAKATSPEEKNKLLDQVNQLNLELQREYEKIGEAEKATGGETSVSTKANLDKLGAQNQRAGLAAQIESIIKGINKNQSGSGMGAVFSDKDISSITAALKSGDQSFAADIINKTLTPDKMARLSGESKSLVDRLYAAGGDKGINPKALQELESSMPTEGLGQLGGAAQNRRTQMAMTSVTANQIAKVSQDPLFKKANAKKEEFDKANEEYKRAQAELAAMIAKTPSEKETPQQKNNREQALIEKEKDVKLKGKIVDQLSIESTKANNEFVKNNLGYVSNVRATRDELNPNLPKLTEVADPKVAAQIGEKYREEMVIRSKSAQVSSGIDANLAEREKIAATAQKAFKTGPPLTAQQTLERSIALGKFKAGDDSALIKNKGLRDELIKASGGEKSFQKVTSVNVEQEKAKKEKLEKQAGEKSEERGGLYKVVEKLAENVNGLTEAQARNAQGDARNEKGEQNINIAMKVDGTALNDSQLKQIKQEWMKEVEARIRESQSGQKNPPKAN